MGHAHSRILRGLLAALSLILSVVVVVGAQETGQIGRLNITDSDTNTFPSVRLQVYGCLLYTSGLGRGSSSSPASQAPPYPLPRGGGQVPSPLGRGLGRGSSSSSVSQTLP